jgi:hypothetical protein
MVPSERVQGTVHYQPNELFSRRYPVRRRLTRGHPGTDIDVAYRKSSRLRKLKRKNVGGTIVTTVLRVEPAHRLASHKRDGEESIAALAAEDGPDDSAHSRR